MWICVDEYVFFLVNLEV